MATGVSEFDIEYEILEMLDALGFETTYQDQYIIIKSITITF